MLRTLICLISMALVPSTSHAQSPSAEAYVRQFMERGKVPGVFVAVVRQDSVLFQKGFGFASVEENLPVTDATCMELGSIGKAFTDEAISHLQHRGLLQLNDPINKYLPDAPASWSSITIQHLMDHTSGIQNYLQDPRFQAAGLFAGLPVDSATHFFLNTISVDSMVRMFYSLPLEFQAGETFSYSNTAYYLLGVIGARVSGKPFFQWVEEVLTAPLNMSGTKANEISAAEGCLRPGYVRSGDPVKLAPLLSSRYAYSAGAWATNGRDMIAYMKAMHHGRLPSDQAGFNRGAQPLEYQLPFCYRLGRFCSLYHGKHVFQHNGGTPGFSSSWIHVLEDSISIMVLANRQDYAPIDALAWDILTLYNPAVRFPDQALQGKREMKYAGLVMKLIKAMQVDAELPKGLSKPLRLFLNSENGRGMWKWILERAYPTAITCVDREDLGSATAYRFQGDTHAGFSYRFTAIVNERGEITQWLWW